MMTLQAMFNKAYLGIAKQGFMQANDPELMRETLATFAALYDLTIPELPAEETAPIPVEPSFESLMAPVLSTREASPSPV